jgi:Protein of unknown function (DUF3551)
MRILALTILAVGTLASAAPSEAQTYAPGYPVCLHVYGPVTYYECNYTSLAQCNATASGRSAQCLVNPYLASAEIERPVPVLRHHRHYRAY